MAKKVTKWKLEKTSDFYHDLAMALSNVNIQLNKPLNRLGIYEMDEMDLAVINYYEKDLQPNEDPYTKYNNDWSGKWIGKNGIKSKEDFLSNKINQDVAIREFHKILWEQFLTEFHELVGTNVNGIIITKSTILGGLHFMGLNNLLGYINYHENGDTEPLDDTGTILHFFTHYKVDYSLDNLELEMLYNTNSNNQYIKNLIILYKNQTTYENFYHDMKTLIKNFAALKKQQLSIAMEQVWAASELEYGEYCNQLVTQFNKDEQFLKSRIDKIIFYILVNGSKHRDDLNAVTFNEDELINSVNILRESKYEEANDILKFLKTRLNVKLEKFFQDTQEKNLKICNDKKLAINEEVNIYRQKVNEFLEELTVKIKAQTNLLNLNKPINDSVLDEDADHNLNFPVMQQLISTASIPEFEDISDEVTAFYDHFNTIIGINEYTDTPTN